MKPRRLEMERKVHEIEWAKHREHGSFEPSGRLQRACTGMNYQRVSEREKAYTFFFLQKSQALGRFLAEVSLCMGRKNKGVRDQGTGKRHYIFGTTEDASSTSSSSEFIQSELRAASRPGFGLDTQPRDKS